MTTTYQMTRSAELESLAFFRGLIDEACSSQTVIDSQACYDLKLAVDEACTNIIQHGYAGMDPGSIILTIEIDQNSARVTITDFGHAFEPVEAPAPDLESESVGGMGLFFIHQSTDEIEYESTTTGNRLKLIKYLKTRE